MWMRSDTGVKRDALLRGRSGMKDIRSADILHMGKGQSPFDSIWTTDAVRGVKRARPL